MVLRVSRPLCLLRGSWCIAHKVQINGTGYFDSRSEAAVIVCHLSSVTSMVNTTLRSKSPTACRIAALAALDSTCPSSARKLVCHIRQNMCKGRINISSHFGIAVDACMCTCRDCMGNLTAGNASLQRAHCLRQ